MPWTKSRHTALQTFIIKSLQLRIQAFRFTSAVIIHSRGPFPSSWPDLPRVRATDGNSSISNQPCQSSVAASVSVRLGPASSVVSLKLSVVQPAPVMVTPTGDSCLRSMCEVTLVNWYLKKWIMY